MEVVKMGSKFGFHSGDVNAKNLVAGSATLSGVQDISYHAISFPSTLKRAPEHIGVSQLAVVSGVSLYTKPISGVFMVSGAASTGFTLYFEENSMPHWEVASGVKLTYMAFDYVPR